MYINYNNTVYTRDGRPINLLKVIARPGARLCAKLADSAILLFPILPAIFLFNTFLCEASIIFAVLWVLAVVTLQAVFLSIRGQSLGKMLVKLRIVNRGTLKNEGFGTNVFLRSWVCGLIGSISMGIYGIIDTFFIFSEENRCLHDRIAGTIVVDIDDLKKALENQDVNEEPEPLWMTMAKRKNKYTPRVILAGVFGAVYILVFVVTIGVLSIKAIADDLQKEKVIKDSELQVQITLPGGWKEEKDNEDKSYELYFTDLLKEKSFSIIKESKENFAKDANIEDYFSILEKMYGEDIKNMEILETNELTIDGCPAKQFIVSGEVNKVKFNYIITAVESDNYFYQLIGGTSKSRFNRNREQLQKITMSFKELSPFKLKQSNGLLTRADIKTALGFIAA